MTGDLADYAGRIIGHYERHAFQWDTDRRNAPWNDKCWHDRFIGMLPQGGTILDLGCGSGSPVACHLEKSGLHVTGIDTSPGLISLCRGRLPQQEWIVSDMRTLSLGRQFDGVLAWDSFFHLKHDDQRRIFDVFAAHAAASGVVMFNTGPGFGEAIGSYKGDPLYHASLDAAEYKTLLARSGFQVVSHAIEDPNAGGRTVWVARSSS